jgi:hypothetical protein
MYLLFYMALGLLMILMRANPLLGSLEGVVPENLDFQGPPLSMALVMDLARITIITSNTV